MTNTRKNSKPVVLKVVGLILAESYQKCRLFAERLHKHHKKKFLQPTITGLLDMDWYEYIHKLRKQIGGKTWSVKDSVVVFLDNKFLGGEKELFDHFKNFYYENPKPGKIKEYAEKEYVSYLNKGNLIYTFIELSLDGEYMGTLLFQLRCDILPKSAKWFTEFCTHERFTYRGSRIHRVCKKGWFQSGEMVNQKEWSLNYLQDENYSYKHDRRGILSFANDGKNKNEFQFFVTFEPAEWMDGKYVAFGRVVEGYDLLRRIENTPCTFETPVRDILITNCGLANVGLGRAIDPGLKMKGITVGEPHIHLEVFTDMLFESFDQALYERLDEEVKKRITEGDWIVDMIWENVMDVLANKRPDENILDPRDKSSQYYLAERYLAGLYSLPDIPDLFLKRLLQEAVDKAVERSGVLAVAKSVADFLLNLAVDQAVMGERIAEEIVQSLVKDVLRIIFGSECSLEEGAISMISSTDSEGLRNSLDDFMNMVGLGDSKEKLAKRSVVAFVWGIVLDMIQNMEVEP